VIDLQVLPAQVTAGQPVDLRLRVTNRGPGLCTNVAATIRVPTGIIHIFGLDKLQVERLESGETVDLVLRVVAERPGEFSLMARNLSYRDHRGQVRRIPEVDAKVVALAPAEPPPRPRLEAQVQTERLPLKAWSDLRATIVNSSAVGVTDLAVSIAGSVTPDPRSRICRVRALGPGASADICFPVRADQAGSAVPVHFDLTYSTPAGQTAISTTARIAVTSERRPPPETASAPKLTILMLAANPLDTRRLKLDDEARRIELAIREGGDRDAQVKLFLAVRAEDIERWLLEVKPQFLHLSGHGADGTFIVQDPHGLETALLPEALGLMLSATAKQLRCVTVNACSTERIARELAMHVPHVVAMRREVLDYVAIQFSIAFYRAIVAGLAIEDAFIAGRAAMGFANADDLDTAILLPEPGHPLSEI
jgi:hypothetical protein